MNLGQETRGISVQNDAKYPKLEPYKPEIDERLTENKKAKRKQRHTAKRVYDRLVENF